MCLVILVRAPCVPVPTGTHGEPPALADRRSLIVHRNTSLLTPRDGPLLCKAVLGSLIEPAPTTNALAGRADLRDGLIISTLYLPETTGNVRHRHVPSRSVCAGYTNCPDMTGTVRQWILVIVSYETSVCFGQHDARE
jgi:hypothetical protein